MSKVQSRNQDGTKPKLTNPSQQLNYQAQTQDSKKRAFRMPGLKFHSIKKYIFNNPEDINLESEARTITEPAKQPQRREAIYPNVTKNAMGTTSSSGKTDTKSKKKSHKGVLDTIRDKRNALRSRASKKFKHKSEEFDYSNNKTESNNNKRTNTTERNIVLEDKRTIPSKSSSTTQKNNNRGANPEVNVKYKSSKDLPTTSSSSESISSTTSSSSISISASCSCSSQQSSSSPSVKKKPLTKPPMNSRRETSRNPSEKLVERKTELEAQRKKPLPPIPRRIASKTAIPEKDPTALNSQERVKRAPNPRPKIPSFGPEKVEKSIQVKAPSRESFGYTTITITTTTTKQIPIPSTSSTSFGNGDPRFSNAVAIRSTSTPSSFGSVKSESSEALDNNMILARALFDFAGETLDDLTFWKGDIITILYIADDGWWIGLVDDNIGKLPSNFVEILPSHNFLARATTDYQSQAKDELSFEENDLILVTKQKGEWLYGELAGYQGWFPFKYAEQVCLTPSE